MMSYVEITLTSKQCKLKIKCHSFCRLYPCKSTPGMKYDSGAVLANFYGNKGSNFGNTYRYTYRQYVEWEK